MNLVNNFQNYLKEIFNMKYINFKILKIKLGAIQFNLDYEIVKI